MKRILFFVAILACTVIQAKTVPFGRGQLTIKKVARNAIRIQYAEQPVSNDLPDWLYVKHEEVDGEVDAVIDSERQTVSIVDRQGRLVVTATRHLLENGVATLVLTSPSDEHLYGLGQFQDGNHNVRGLSRRLTQVNTQIAIPMLLSSKGYGLLWNNYGLTEFNPADQQVMLSKVKGVGNCEVVNITTTEGGKKEVRERNIYEAKMVVPEEGDYSLLLDVGQKMASRHHLMIDGTTVIDLQNLWLPPTTSTIVHLKRGAHTLKAELSNGDHPVVHYKKVTNKTVFRSPVAHAVDYTVMVGTADEVIATYRDLTGEAPLMPRWATGYIHCRERFHSQEEILQTAERFQKEQMPLDVLVQDWQYWGKHGWNSMVFDEDQYPDPKQMMHELHQQGIRLMLSVWSKIDKNAEVGKRMEQEGHYIPGTDWIDFFSPDAAKAYWQNFSTRLLPLGIDAWWQDATEPENDDLVGRRVNRGLWSGEQVRNVYPLLVNKTVYEGLRKDQPHKRPMILTRCGFPGIQRYGSALWSGDVGNDWDSFRRQITAGLGMQSAGIPWWTYDAGGFFRPADQYTNADYIERMLRWIETSVYLPLMRVHGYMSNTEPWNYGEEAKGIIRQCLNERYQLQPYVYSHAADVSFQGSTLMRPLVFDFSDDDTALEQNYEYMFGKSLLVSPVVEAKAKQWSTYLPRHAAGWYDYHTGKYYQGGKSVIADVGIDRIPVYVRGGSILPLAIDPITASRTLHTPLEIRIYPGADATFTLYEDDGWSNDYEHGACSRITFRWDDAHQRLVVDDRKGSFAGMPVSRCFKILMVNGKQQTVNYEGKRLAIDFSDRYR